MASKRAHGIHLYWLTWHCTKNYSSARSTVLSWLMVYRADQCHGLSSSNLYLPWLFVWIKVRNADSGACINGFSWNLVLRLQKQNYTQGGRIFSSYEFHFTMESISLFENGDSIFLIYKEKVVTIKTLNPSRKKSKELQFLEILL